MPKNIAIETAENQLGNRAFQFAIRIDSNLFDSSRYANRFESIRFVKKIGLSIH